MARGKEELDRLLQPIQLSYTGSIRSRQNYVLIRRDKVKLVYPFLSTKQKLRADAWLNENKFSDLWD